MNYFYGGFFVRLFICLFPFLEFYGINWYRKQLLSLKYRILSSVDKVIQV